MSEISGGKITRRRLLKTTAASVPLLAGCMSYSTPNGTSGSGLNGSKNGDVSYSVTMAPVGKVDFSRVPQKWSTYSPGYADMGVALDVGDRLNSIGKAGRYHTGFYDELPGVGIDKSKLTQMTGKNGIGKEVFYQLDPDIFVIDPEWLIHNSFFGLRQKDVDEIRKNVAPFIGNTIFRRTDSWHDYRYYTMYEALEKVAEVFQRKDKYSNIKKFHDSFIDNIRAKLPPKKDAPEALLVWAGSDKPKDFTPYRISDKGTSNKQYHDLNIKDALTGTDIDALSESNRGKIDFENVLDIDPELMFIRGHESQTEKEFRSTVVQYLKSDPVASDIKAVKNDKVFRGGPIYEGPIQNFFLTERVAKQVYPDSYSGKLFDRKKLADIIKSKDD
ncbi:MAG: ABC transporter substrate-binding protein [Halobacteria archaeon]